MAQASRQSNFSGGEVAPEFYGRVDSPLYAHSLRTCKNFLPIQHGALVNRPGTKLINGVKNSAKKVRLVPFVFSDAQTFALEFGDLYIRFYQNGSRIETAPGVAYELVSPWTEAMLPYLKFAQSGDVITICYGGQANGAAATAPRDLSRITNTNWTLNSTSFSPSACFTESDPFIGRYAYAAGVTYAMGDRAVDGNVSYFSLQDGNVGHTPSTSPTYWQPASDASHAPRKWTFGVTLTFQDTTTGISQETTLSDPIVFNDAVYPDRPMKLFTPAPPSVLTGFKLIQYNFYAGTSGGLLGFIGAVDANAVDTAVPLGAWSNLTSYPTTAYVVYGGTTYVSLQGANLNHQPDISPTWWLAQPVASYIWDGRAPDYSQPPPKGTDPFLIGATHYYPACVGYFEQRRLFARTSKQPNNFFGSAVGNFIDFDRPVLAPDDVAIQFAIASQVLEEIRWILGVGRSLALGTNDGVHAARGGSGGAGPITASSIDLKRQTRRGSSWLTPLTVGNTIIFNTAKGSSVRDLSYDWQSDSYTGTDVSRVAQHLFGNHTLVDWAFAELPYPVAYMVRDDGVLLSLTYSREDQMVAWARHTTGEDANGVADAVESLCVVPEGAEDAVYVAVRRTISEHTSSATYNRYIERFASRTLPTVSAVDLTTGAVSSTKYDAREFWFLDCASQFDGRNTSVATVALSNETGWAGGDTMDCTIVGNAADPLGGSGFAYPTLQLGDMIVLDPDGAAVPLRIIQVKSATVALVEADADVPTYFRTLARTSWAWGRSKVVLSQFADHPLDSGVVAGHRGITALVDGKTIGVVNEYLSAQTAAPNWDPNTNTLTLKEPGVIVLGGLSYNSDAGLLDVADPRPNVRAVSRVFWEVVNSRSLYAGEDFDHLRPWKQRVPSTGIPDLETGRVEVTISSSWNSGGRAVVRQFEPLPLTIVAATRSYEPGGPL